MTERVILPEHLGLYVIGDHLESGWGWDVYEAYVTSNEEGEEPRACHLRVFFNQPEGGLLHTRLMEARDILAKHPHLNVQAIRDVSHAEITGRLSVLLVEEELQKEWVAPKPSDYRAVMLQLLAAAEHLEKVGLPGSGLSGSNLARNRNGKAVLANLSSNWEQLWAGRSRAGASDYYHRLPPESALSPSTFDGPQWVWSAGSLLVEALSGMQPTAIPKGNPEEEDVFDTAISTFVNQQPDGFRECQLMSLPEDIQNVLRRALSPNPDDRYANLVKFSEALETPIRTGKVGDRFVMPTSSAVQDVSPPPKNTFWGYALGVLLFFLFMVAVFYVVVIYPSHQKGATLSGSGPGVILEPDTEWENALPPKTSERDAAVPVIDEPADESPAMASGEPSVSDAPAPVSEPAPDRDVAVQVEDVTPGDAEVLSPPSAAVVPTKEIVSPPKEVVKPVESIDTPVVSPEPPMLSEKEQALETALAAEDNWQEAMESLARVSWLDTKRKPQALLMRNAKGWVIAQKTSLTKAENLPVREAMLSKVERFWAQAPGELQQMPDVLALLKEIDAQRTTMRIQILNKTSEGVAILDKDGETLSSIAAGETTVLVLSSDGEDDIFMRAQGRDAWVFSEREFTRIRGGYEGWELINLDVHKAVVVPVLPDESKGITIEYAKRNSAEWQPVTGELEVDPGDYSFVYSRVDYFPIRKVLRFSKAFSRYKVDLPSDDTWVPTPDLKQLLEWESRLGTEPAAVMEEMKTRKLTGLKSPDHQDRLAFIQNASREQAAALEVTINFVQPERFVPPVVIEFVNAAGEVSILQSQTDNKVPPGKYRVTFKRLDYGSIGKDLLILPKLSAIDLVVPLAADWVPSDSLTKLKALEEAMQKKDNRLTVQLIQELRRAPLEWDGHRDLYIRLRKQWYGRAVGR